MNTEPVAITGALTTLVGAVIAMLQGFAIIHWTAAQMGLVSSVWTAIVGIFLVAVVRQKVTPINKDPHGPAV